MTALTRALRLQWLLILSALTLVIAFAPGVGAADCGESAHPSGNDRCAEPGGSGTQGDDGTQIQGDAASDPDDNGNPPARTNGGADEPGGPGGENPLDQDGNNGCGNDQDFEDDNEGLCRGPQAAGSVDGTDAPGGPGGTNPGGTEVKPRVYERTPDGTRVNPDVLDDELADEDSRIAPARNGRVNPPAPRVPDAAPAAAAATDDLPATGLDLTIGFLALGAILLGTLLVRRARSTKTS